MAKRKARKKRSRSGKSPVPTALTRRQAEQFAGSPIGIGNISKGRKYATVRLVVDDCQRVRERILLDPKHGEKGIPWRHANGSTITVLTKGTPSWDGRKNALRLIIGENTVRVPLKYAQTIPMLVCEFNRHVNRKAITVGNLDEECGGLFDSLMDEAKDTKKAKVTSELLRAEANRLQLEIDAMVVQEGILHDKIILTMASRDEIRAIIGRLEAAPKEDADIPVD